MILSLSILFTSLLDIDIQWMQQQLAINMRLYCTPPMLNKSVWGKWTPVLVQPLHKCFHWLKMGHIWVTFLIRIIICTSGTLPVLSKFSTFPLNTSWQNFQCFNFVENLKKLPENASCVCLQQIFPKFLQVTFTPL